MEIKGIKVYKKACIVCFFFVLCYSYLFVYRKVLLINNEISSTVAEIETKIAITKADIQQVQQVSADA